MQPVLNVFTILLHSKRHNITYFPTGPLGKEWQWLLEDVALRESKFVCLLGNVRRFHSTSYALTFSLTFENRYLSSYTGWRHQGQLKRGWDIKQRDVTNDLKDFLINLSY
jgi:hypothetical protein